MRITALAGGVGGARFLRGLRAAAPDAEITVIGNTGDDIMLFGLHVCPDLDTVMYTLGGGVSEEQGWGRAGETHVVQDELTSYGAGPDWFALGDRDFATHIARTSMLHAGLPLSVVTRRLCDRWRPGVTLLPMTDDDVQTHVVIDDDAGRRTVHFQEWWVRLHAKVPAVGFVFSGADRATPAPGVVEAIAAADFVLLPPSNPVVSIGVILAVPGIAGIPGLDSYRAGIRRASTWYEIISGHEIIGLMGVGLGNLVFLGRGNFHQNRILHGYRGQHRQIVRCSVVVGLTQPMWIHEVCARESQLCRALVHERNKGRNTAANGVSNRHRRIIA